MRFAAACTLAVLLLTLPLSPQLNTSGRPGAFRFLSADDMQAHGTQLQQARAALDRLSRAGAAATDVQIVAAFLDRTEERLAGGATPTAAAVERRLTEAKGNSMCTACHGQRTEPLAR